MIFSYLSVFGQFNESAPWISQDGENKRVQEKTLEEISTAFQSYWKNKDHSKKGSGHKPFKRWEHHWQHQLSKNGTLIKPQSTWQSWKKKNTLEKSPVSDWKSLGPYTTNVKYGQGRVNTFIIDPNDVNTYYVGAPAGGLWRSTDAGKNWTPLTDDIPQIGVSGIAIDKNDSNVIYIATGDDDARDT